MPEEFHREFYALAWATFRALEAEGQGRWQAGLTPIANKATIGTISAEDRTALEAIEKITSAWLEEYIRSQKIVCARR